MIVWLLHGCRLEVTRHLVQIIRDCQCACGLKKKKRHQKSKNCSSWWRISEKSYSALHWITLHFNSPSLRTFTEHPLSNKRTTWTKRGWLGLYANSSIHSHESVFTRHRYHHHHTEDTNCWCCFFLFFLLTILYRRINTTAEWRSLWKCDIFQCRQFPHAGSCVSFALHISLVSYLKRRVTPLSRKNHIAIILRDLHGN